MRRVTLRRTLRLPRLRFETPTTAPAIRRARGRPSAEEIAAALGRSDPVLRQLIRKVGVSDLPRDPGGFPSLVRAIINQQISSPAGAAILRRLSIAGSDSSLPLPSWFRDATDAAYRAAGVSPQKVGYLRDLARRVTAGELALEEFRHRDDRWILESLTKVRGIGTWTGQMYLIFSLHRPDILPTGDLGIRKAVQRAYDLRGLPAETTVARIGRPWRPYRSHASWYLWQSLRNAQWFEPDRGRVRRRSRSLARSRGVRPGA